MATRTDPAAALVARLHSWSRTVVDAELRRLAGRAPGLRRHDIEVLDAALDELVESLVLARIRAHPERAGELARLFDSDAAGRG